MHCMTSGWYALSLFQFLAGALAGEVREPANPEVIRTEVKAKLFLQEFSSQAAREAVEEVIIVSLQ